MAEAKPKVTVFSTTYCPSCQTLKQWLDQQQIEYEAVNVEEEPQRQNELVEKSGGFLVPVTLITHADGREEVVSGTQYAKIKTALGISRGSGDACHGEDLGLPDGRRRAGRLGGRGLHRPRGHLDAAD